MTFPAHILVLKTGNKKEHSVLEHCKVAAEYAKDCASPLRVGSAAYLAGLFHDMGKCTVASKAYQEATARGEPVRRGSVIHTFQSCRFLLDGHSKQASNYMDLTRELLAYAASAHHGSFDCCDENRKSGFDHRVLAKDIGYEEARLHFLEELGGENIANELLQEAHKELLSVYETLDNMSDQNQDEDGTEFLFYVGLLARSLQSAVIEGDRRNTAEFLSNAIFPHYPKDMRPIWRARLAHMEAKLHEFPADTPIQLARRQISNLCLDSAENSPGIYRLSVPTGAGKTLSGLRFALAHAARWNKRRIIFTAPLLTILEQNARILREYIGDDSLVLEHHSNVLRESKEWDELDQRELLMENWSAPIIITTMVQLLNTMFDGSTSSIRRFWSLGDSVIVIDEVQTVPNHMLTMFNLTINYLTEVCGATVVLCSATQPCLERTRHPILGTPKDIVPFDAELWRTFIRTNIRQTEDRTLEDIPVFVLSKLEDADSLLVVCNKKSEAEYIFRQTSQLHQPVFHLSAAMCMAHRRLTLDKLEKALADSRRGGPKVLCISTQVIEAGVDISFGQVIRLTAGLDSIIQSAGRCNRNGEQTEPAPVYVLNCVDESLRGLREIDMGKRAAQALFLAFERDAERFRNDLSSDEAVRYYYHDLYSNMREGYQDYILPKQKVSLFSLLSDNSRYANSDSECYGVYCMNQAFRTAGFLFQVFDDDTETVVVPFGEGKDLITELASHGNRPDPAFLAGWLERVKPYTVSVYGYQKKALSQGGISAIADILVLQPSFYHEELGLVMDQEELEFLEV